MTTQKSRRRFLKKLSGGSLTLALRSAITGLPPLFLLHRVLADEPAAKIAILACSGQGQPLNVAGPGTYDAGLEDVCQHPQAREVDTQDVGTVIVNGETLTAASFEESAELRLGDRRVRMARAFSTLDADLLEHLVWFNYQTTANIHPEFPTVTTAYGRILGLGGRGSEQLPSAIAQETASLLGTTTAEPFVIGRNAFSYNGAPLASYSPMKIKSLAANVGQAIGGPENFGALYDHFIDETYADIRRNGTPEQLRFLDSKASSRTQAAAFGMDLGQLLSEITDDSIESELRTAVAIAKLRLAPVIVTSYSFGGDNHSDSDLSIESGESIRMVKAIDSYWKAAKELGTLSDTVLATVDVFGRTARRAGKGGRSHDGSFTSALVLGEHLRGGVVGGFEVSGTRARATGIESATGRTSAPDIAPDETLRAYHKSVMLAAGVPSERRDDRIPAGVEVTSFLG
ncbi:MAG: hypothetical protein AAGE52_24875 [Myxococcota bacterium]